MEIIIHWVTQFGYIGIFSLLMLGIIGVPVPDEMLLTFSGYLVFKGKLQPVLAFAAAFFGSACGISLSYGLGRLFGIILIEKYGSRLYLTADKMQLAREWFNRAGKWLLALGYFIPGLRHLTAYVSGTAKLPFAVFALFAYAGAAVWTASFITLGYFMGQEWHRFSDKLHRHLVFVSAITFSSLLLYFLLRYKIRKRK